MVRTSTAEKNNYVCPVCGDDLKHDLEGRGYVAHKYKPGCPLERGEKDPTASGGSTEPRPTKGQPR